MPWSKQFSRRSKLDSMLSVTTYSVISRLVGLGGVVEADHLLDAAVKGQLVSNRFRIVLIS
jgi:hypothetical protein